ncbi:MAG: pyridoxamine 5'-phosphate oxidase family protein [Candidatus Omnitrophica bacterium]|nr:pyridoxamine 5'-phosphate oxidase family protein [Candidatus Omnitrophota bacterium]
MVKLTESVIRFFESQGCVILATIDALGFPHSACKDIIKIDREGKIYLLDVYHGKTFENLKRSSLASITAFNEHKFIGYCLKGKASSLSEKEMTPEVLKSWEERITNRATQRLLKNLREEKVNSPHPEVSLPKPKYLILFEVQEVVDLAPYNLR